MIPEYEERIKQADLLLAELCSQNPIPVSELKQAPKEPGVYVFREGSTYLYVGRTKNFHQRLQNHTSGHPEQSAFAFRLARESTGKLKATYKPAGSREALMNDPQFRNAFDQSITRVRNMEARFVLIEDNLMQHIFEVYAAIALKTPYNGFMTS